MHLHVQNVSLRFEHVEVLSRVSLSVQSGEVVCLLGDNGAGKSSLIRVLSGVYRPSDGAYLIDGQAVTLASPRDALAKGIATVHQDLGLIPLMSVWRNFILGAEQQTGGGPFKRIDARAARATVTNALAELSITIADVDQAIANLSGGERQSLAIARAMQRGARILILDEPTAALGVKQAEIVLRNIAKARERGIGVLLVTHNPHHAYEVGERFVVLAHGSVAMECVRAQTDIAELAALMAGAR